MKSVMQEWTFDLPMMQQTVLICAVRGPDGIGKYHPSKFLLRWYRRCVLYSSLEHRIVFDPFDRGGGSFCGPSFNEVQTAMAAESADKSHDMMRSLVSNYLRSLDELPHHFQLHFMHAAQIIGYKHPKPFQRAFWNETYLRLVSDMHLFPETMEQMDKRLSDNRDNWLARNDPATVD